tara:strand:+ start:432 stop:611 length:180 start_codon:yes stop_codon:yes gene_type:complete
MNTKPFAMTEYSEAKSFLKVKGMSHLIEKELSTDGYTLIALANSILDKELCKQATLDEV